MFKKALLAIGLLGWLCYPAQAQNTTCSDRPTGDSSNACANTRFVMTNGGGGGGGGGIPEAPNDGLQYGRQSLGWTLTASNPGSSAYNSLVTQIASDPNFWLSCLSFTSTTNGCVLASGGIANTFLRSDGTFVSVDSMPIGAVVAWSGATIPTGYLLADGQQILRNTYTDLLTVLTFSQSINCSNGSPTITVPLATSDRVPIGAAIEASGCFAAGTTVASKASGSLTFNNNALATNTVTAKIFPWGNGDGTSTFNLPNLQGRTPVGRDNMSGAIAGVITSPYFGANPDAVNAAGGVQFGSITLNLANLPPYTPAGTVDFAGVTVNISDPGHVHVMPLYSSWNLSGLPGVTSGGVAASLVLGNTNTQSAGTGITASLAGGSAAFTGTAQGGTAAPATFSVIQPSLTIDYLVKVLPGGSSGGGGGGGFGIATYPDMYLGVVADKIVTPSTIWPPEVTITYGTTTTFDMSTFRDAKVTLTGNITTMILTNPTVGKSGSITFIQDGTGSRTTVWDTKFKFAGGTLPVLSTTASAVDILSYQCRTSTFCFAALMKDVK